MYMNRKFGALSSSTNPDQLANTVRGFILTFSSVIVLVATNLLGFNLNAEDVSDLATAVGAMAGAVWVVYGLVQKLVVKFAGQ